MVSLGTLLFFLQCQAIFVFSGFFAAWHWAAWRRRVGLRRIERRGTSRTPYCVDFDRDATRDDTEVHLGTRSRRPRHPKVAVVCPVKRFGGETARNWRAQMTSEYGGDLEYVFVAERVSDSAVAGFAELMRDMRDEGEVEAEKNGALGAPGTTHAVCLEKIQFSNRSSDGHVVRRRRARLLVAGSSTSCSQKIHSMLAGALASDEDTTFVLFLDDDIRTHRNTIGVLVRSMTTARANCRDGKTPFLTNGFPMDLPSRDAPFANYLTFVYHLVLLIAFSQGEVTKNVWGGCMMLRRESLANDAYGFVTAYRNGGYSDDLILASACDERREIVGCPFEAVFPQRLDETQTLRQWWNYLRRQLFVMDTYANDWNKNVNHGMLFALTYLSLATTTALAACGAHLFFVAAKNVFFFKDAGNASPPPPTLSIATFACFALALRAARRMYHDTGALVAALGDADAFEKVRRIDWKKVALAFVATYAIVPLAAAATLASPGVEWAGIRYRKKNGKVTRLES